MIPQHQGIKFVKPTFSSWHTFKPGPLPKGLQASSETVLEAITVRLAASKDVIFAKMITDEMCTSALARGCGISRRNPSDIEARMREGSRLGFEPVTYGEITREKKFWEGCKSCVNYPTLLGKDYKNCFCTAMLFNPEQEESETETEHRK